MASYEKDSIKWLIRSIIIVAFIAIVVILIRQNFAPSETTTPINSTPSSSQTTELPTSASDLYNEEDSQSSSSALPLPQPTEPTSSQEDTTSNSITTTRPPAPTSQSTESKCYHQENGICLDDYEDEAYSAGLYDHSYGYYGTSLDYPDNCNSICKESIEDTYEEGWYDSF